MFMQADDSDLNSVNNYCTEIAEEASNVLLADDDLVLEDRPAEESAQEVSRLSTRSSSPPASIILPGTTVILPNGTKSSLHRYTNIIVPPVPKTQPQTKTLSPKVVKISKGPTLGDSRLATAGNISSSLTLEPQVFTAPPAAKLSLQGRPVVVNGEPGVFIPNSLMGRNNIELSPLPMSLGVKLDNTSLKLKRTVGISTAHEVPTEIGPQHYGNNSVAGRNGLGSTSNFLHFSDRVNTVEHCTQTVDKDFYNFDAFREKYLPQSERYKYNYTISEGSDLVEFRMTGVICKQSVSEWVKQVETISNVHYRIWKTYSCKKDGAYKVDLRCHMNQRKSVQTMKGKDFGCRSMLAIKVDPFQISKGVANQALRERFRCRVRFRYMHSHTEEDSLRHMSVRKDIRDKIINFFKQGMSITDAYTTHYQELKTEYGSKFSEITGNRSLCPDKGYFYNVWKIFCNQRYGKVVRPPKSSIPTVPWNKGLKGITSLKEFFPPDTQGLNVKKRRGEPGKKEMIRQAALEGIETTLMESIRRNPEAYSRAVTCFVEVWRSMDDKDRLAWLQTKIEDNPPDRVMLVTTDQLDETIQATENIDFMQFADDHRYPDVALEDNGQEVELSSDSRKRLKLSDGAAAEPMHQFTLCHFPV